MECWVCRRKLRRGEIYFRANARRVGDKTRRISSFRFCVECFHEAQVILEEEAS